MIIRKISDGFVVQDYDTETQKFVRQEFHAQGEVDFEDEQGHAVSDDNFADAETFETFLNTYLPYDMVQPE